MTARILKEDLENYLEGCTMYLGKHSDPAVKKAKEICQKLRINHHTIDISGVFNENIIKDFEKGYLDGITPLPCAKCNKEIKFKAFLNYAINNLKADYIATGHYARIAKINKQNHSDNYQLLKALDNNKDQSYFLHALNQEQLSKSLFPIGEIDKPEIRAIAKNLNLITHDKKDSTGICFIGEVKFKKFLSKYLPAKPGNIIDENNNIIGQHDGLMYYTIGQRQGLNLGGLKNYSELPWYVASKNLINNTLTVVQGSDHSLLLQSSANIINYNFIDPEFLLKLNQNKTLDINIKARYRQADQAAKISLDNNHSNNNNLLVTFNTPQRAITPGQAMVFYEQDVCLGGGTIV
jgi:tRNA-specific 2-thiouridylase